MSYAYDIYLAKHRENVLKAFDWIAEHLPEYLAYTDPYSLRFIIENEHDKSKNDPEEYDAYDRYFYGGNRSNKVVNDFNRAWLHHIHHNPHHWQHWVLIEDDGNGEPILIQMPLEAVIEMICDWWSFSFEKGELEEIFTWYEAHQNIKLHPNTRRLVEDILADIKKKLEEAEK